MKADNLVCLSPFQREIIEAALAGHDVYVQAATSFGKSLCFQLPAVVDQGGKLLPCCKMNIRYFGGLLITNIQ